MRVEMGEKQKREGPFIVIYNTNNGAEVNLFT